VNFTHRWLFALAPFTFLPALGCAVVPDNNTTNPTANFFAVSDRVYRGSRPTYEGLEQLVGLKIKSVLDLEDNDDAVAQEGTWATQVGLKQFRARMTGTSAPDSPTVEYALQVLNDDDNAPIFVHCAKGADRTGVIVALYRIFHDGWSAAEAKSEMENHGFNNSLLALKEFFEKKSGLDD
jgi:protein tyrosine/serine phosphatase